MNGARHCRRHDHDCHLPAASTAALPLAGLQRPEVPGGHRHRMALRNLENFMVPKEIVFLPELPKTNTGKISKKTLGEKAAS